MSHIWMSHVTHMNESCHTYEWVMSHIWMSHVAHITKSCHTRTERHTGLILSRNCLPSLSCMCVPWLSCDMTHPRLSMGPVWLSLSCVTWLIHMCVAWLSRNWVKAHTYMSDCKHVNTSHGTHVHESRHTYKWVISHKKEIAITGPYSSSSQSCHTNEWVTVNIFLCHVAHERRLILGTGARMNTYE